MRDFDKERLEAVDKQYELQYKITMIIVVVAIVGAIGIYLLQGIVRERKSHFLLSCSTMQLSEENCLSLYELPK